jgi:hypothetical protein
LVEVLAQWLQKCPVFSEGAQDALGFDHRNARRVGNKKTRLYCIMKDAIHSRDGLSHFLR